MMEREPPILISVIVPIYKIESYLRKCVDSIIAQTYTNLEIILVNDGSPDKCPQICDEYAKKDKRIKVIHKANGGLVSARKAGLQLSSGELIGYVDGDDWVEPEFYQCLYDAWLDTKADIIADGFSRDLLDSTQKIRNNIAAGCYKDKEMSSHIYPKMLCAGNFFYFGLYSYLWNKLFKREIVFEAQMSVDNHIMVGEDVACLYPALLKANSLCIIDKCFYHYQQRAGSMLKTIENFREENRRLDLLENYLKKVIGNSEYKGMLLPQINRYIKGLRLMRGDYSEYSSDYHFDRNLEAEDRIAIYSAGTFGQNLYTKILYKQSCKMGGWYDPDFLQYQKQGLEVESPEAIDTTAFDKIIIASLDERFINDAITELNQKDIDKSRILVPIY